MKRINLRPWEAAGLAAGRITALCRVVKPQPPAPEVAGGLDVTLRDIPETDQWFAAYVAREDDFGTEYRPVPQFSGVRWNSPFGAPGTVLACAEKYACPDIDYRKSGKVAYDADGVCGCWIGAGEDREFICHGRVIQASGYHAYFPASGSTTRGLADYSHKRTGEYPSYTYHWRSAQTMPDFAIRHRPTVVAVRCCRVGELRHADVAKLWIRTAEFVESEMSYVQRFDRDNGNGAWARNPWVFVAEVRV